MIISDGIKIPGTDCSGNFIILLGGLFDADQIRDLVALFI